MMVKSLELQNFRNYESLKLEFDGGTNILYGDNAQGKTNVLEALYLCGTTKSHRTSMDREMIRFQEEEAHVRLYVDRKGIQRRIDFHLKKNKPKGIAVDGIPIRKASDLIGILNVVFFSPEDLNVIKDGPAQRRRFVNMELCQLSRIYYQNLADYNRTLKQRNSLLKDISFHPSLADTLDVWDLQLAGFGRKIMEERSGFIEKLNATIQKIHFAISGGREELELEYEPDVEPELFYDRLVSTRKSDLLKHSTGVGPHKDDVIFRVNGVDVRRFGSQGQQRTAALSLKLAEIELVRMMIRDTPVLLLDDVLSELDGNRQNYLLNCIHDVQTVISCTGLDDFVKNRFEIDRVFQVVDGVVRLGDRKEN